MFDGHLLYVRPDGGIMAVPFNTSTLDIGTPIQVGDSVAVRSWFAGADAGTRWHAALPAGRLGGATGARHTPPASKRC